MNVDLHERPGDMAELPPPNTVAWRVLHGPERAARMAEWQRRFPQHDARFSRQWLPLNQAEPLETTAGRMLGWVCLAMIALYLGLGLWACARIMGWL